MHMMSKKDLNSAEVDTLTKSCSPSIVITAKEKCKRMKRPQCASKNWKILDDESPREHASSLIARKAFR